MLNMPVLDYEVLARQKRERLLTEAERLRVLVRVADKPKRVGVRGLLGRLLGRLRVAERRVARAA